MSFATDEEFHRMLARLLSDQAASESSRHLLLSCLGYLEQLPADTAPAVGSLLESPSRKLRGEAIRLVVNSNSYSGFQKAVEAMAIKPGEHPLIRATALEGIAGHGGSLSNKQFAVAEGLLSDPESAPEVKRQAAQALSRLAVRQESPDQARALVRLVAAATPFHLSLLLKPFQNLDPGQWPNQELDALGANLAGALKESPGRKGLSGEQLATLSGRFPPAYPQAHRAFDEFARTNTADSRQREETLARLLKAADQGNASRGRVLFHAHRSTCSLCHRIDNRGGTLGPNLSRIGAIRSAKDFFEAIVFPSATVVNGFESYLLADNKGTAHTGLIHRETADAIYLRQADQQIIRIPRGEIKTLLRSPVSLMPAGLEGILSDQDLADLVAYLQVCK